jgi:error-prone DNA polymerase
MIEWLATSNFSFLEGASTPEELMQEAARLGYEGLCLGDRMGLYGLAEALRTKPKEIFHAPGIRLHFDRADPLFVFPLHKAAYSALCAHLSEWALAGMQAHEKGLTPLPWPRFRDFLASRRATIAHDFAIVSVSGRFYPWPQREAADKLRVSTQDIGRTAPSFSVPPTLSGQTPFWLLELSEICGRGEASALSLAWPLTLAPGCEDLQNWLLEHARKLRLPLLATSLPLFARKEDRELCDLVAAIRHRLKITDLGYVRQANSERRLLSWEERTLHQSIWREKISSRGWEGPDPFERTRQLAERQAFSLKELRYRYPAERIPPGETPSSHFRKLVYKGAEERYPDGIPQETVKQLAHELKLISELGYEDYFLTIHDTLSYAREKKILCQGRGSAANSIACYCLGITSIDPVQMELLFERFISAERAEAPDIDVDFEHERREEVLQELYARYGRKRAAMVANVIRFRGRMAVRETGIALGLSEEQLASVSRFMGRESLSRLDPQLLPKGVNVPLRSWQWLIYLARKLKYTPRHLGLHPCGMVLASENLTDQCIVEPARKELTGVIPWNKDDVEFLGWIKVDFLSLGMLTAIRKCFALIGDRNVTRKPFELATVPHDDAATYKAIRAADTVGVFQIESRAQMAMLPRLAPRNFYDLVVEVAIVRPGPLQGGMVHPYLKRRQGLEKWDYDHPDLESILSRTLGVPIFQEQVMKMAVKVAGFTPGEADQMRRVMSGAWRSKTQMHRLKERLIGGMLKHGLSQEFGDRIYKQMEGFGEYGFPESHAASFATLTYISSYLKTHHPAEFLAALLNSQPLGFYSARALVGDAQRHAVPVLPIDLFASTWDAQVIAPMPSVQGSARAIPAVRLGFSLIKGLARDEATKVERLRSASWRDIDSLRFHLGPSTTEKLVRAGACRSLEAPAAAPNARAAPSSSSATPPDPRPQQLWQLWGARNNDPAAPRLALTKPVPLPTTHARWSEWESLLRDYRHVGLSVTAHPAAHARERFFRRQAPWVRAYELLRLPHGQRLTVIGLLSVKQRPPTAGGMCFLTLEDESGFFNLVLRPDIYERYRLFIEESPLLAAAGRLQRAERRDRSANESDSVSLSLDVATLWNPFERDAQATANPGEIAKSRPYG